MNIANETLEVEGNVAIVVTAQEKDGVAAAMCLFELDGNIIAVPGRDEETAEANAGSFLRDIHKRRKLAHLKWQEAQKAREAGKLRLAKHLAAEAVKLNGGKLLKEESHAG